MFTINLDDTMVSIAKRLAEKRHDTFSHDGYEDTAFGKTSYGAHLLGAKAEVAISCHYGILVDMKERLTGDCHDFEAMFDGREITIDVKATTYNPPELLVRETKTESDFYISCHINNRNARMVEVLGWAERPDLLDANYVESPEKSSNHMNYQMQADQLDRVPSPDCISAL